MSKIQIFQNGKILREVGLPTTWETLESVLSPDNQCNLTYETHDEQTIKVQDQQSLAKVIQDWETTYKPNVPLKMKFETSQQDFQYVPSSNTDVSNAFNENLIITTNKQMINLLDPSQTIFGSMSMGESITPNQAEIEKFQKVQSFNLDDNDDQMNGDNRIAFQRTTSDFQGQEIQKVELFPLFFKDQEKMSCVCQKANQQMMCSQCKGTGMIEINPKIKQEIERILQRKIQDKFANLQKMYKDKYSLQINNLKEFKEAHIQLVNQGKLSSKSNGHQINLKNQDRNQVENFSFNNQLNQQAQDKRYSLNSQIQKPPIVCSYPQIQNSKFQPTASVVSSHSSVSNISNHSQKNWLFQRNSTSRKSAIYAPISNRSSNDMMSSVKISPIQISSSQMTQSNMSRMINSKATTYSMKIEGEIEPQVVEPESKLSVKVVLRNVGQYPWPSNTVLRRIDDYRKDRSNEIGSVIQCRAQGPQEVGCYDIQIISPTEENTYVQQWRLSYDEGGDRYHFGPRIDIRYDVKKQHYQKKVEECINLVKELTGGNLGEIENYVTKVLSQNENISLNVFSNKLMDDLQKNPDLVSGGNNS